MTSWQDATSAHGAALADFIEHNVRHLSTHHQRYLRDWRGGFRPSYYEADKVLVRVGLHPSLVPDEVWSMSEPDVVTGDRCVVCGGAMYSGGGRYRRYCCDECERIGTPRQVRPKQYKTCAHCGKRFERPESVTHDAGWQSRRYCTEACRLASRTYRRWNRRKRKVVAA